MLRRKLLIYLTNPKVTPKPLYFRSFCASKPKPEQEETEKKKGPVLVITPKRILIGLIGVSWIFLFKLWYGAEEAVRMRAAEYYEQGIVMDASPPEEYRREYVITLFNDFKLMLLG